MSKKIRTLGFRNGLFTGQIEQEQKFDEIPSGIGIVVDDMFLTCLSTWSQRSSDSIKASGPSVLFYPNREIFYSEQFPNDGRFIGFWSFVTPQLQVYGLGESKNLAIVQPGGNTLSRINNKQNMIEHVQDFTYRTQDQKWRRIQQILGSKIDKNLKSVDIFIENAFATKINNAEGRQNFVTAKPKRSQVFYGIINNNEGIGINLKSQNEKVLVSSIGYYKQYEPTQHMSFGRKYFDQINSSSYKIEEGNFDNEELFAFNYTQDRPAQSYKSSRKYFRQSTSFSNKFLHLNDAGVAYKKLKAIEKEYNIRVDSKYGQRIIEGQPKRQEELEQDILQHPKYESQKYKQASYSNREYNLSEAKAKIEQEINKRKTIGSVNYTAAFSAYANKTGSNNFTNSYHVKDPAPSRESKRKSIESSPIEKYKISYSEEMTNRNQRSPTRSNQQKYNYTDYQEIQPPITSGDWKKQNKTYYMEEKYQPSSPVRVVTKQNRVPVKKVNQFTLYPVEVQRQYVELAEYEKTQIQREAQRQRQRQARLRNMQKQRILRQIEYEAEKQKQRKQKQEKQNQRQRMMVENNYLPTKRVPNTHFLATIQKPVLHQTNSQSAHFHQPPPSLYSGSHPIEQTSKRRYFHTYNYTEQPRFKQTTPTKIGKTDPKVSYSPSPINRLRIKTDIEPTRKEMGNNREVQKSPIARPVGRKIYSYIDE